MSHVNCHQYIFFSISLALFQVIEGKKERTKTEGQTHKAMQTRECTFLPLILFFTFYIDAKRIYATLTVDERF
jgi:hypothetical protein